jgi:DNA polymerase III subunit alpha
MQDLSQPPTFVHLRCHSEYSIVDGIVRINDYVNAAKNDAMPALALTDLSNLFGAIKFYKAARKQGIKAIIGADVWLENSKKPEQPTRALLLVQNLTGYTLLCELLSRAYLENQTRGRPELKPAWFQNGSEGLLLLSGNHDSDIGLALAQSNSALAIKLAKRWSELFPNRFYLEVQRVADAAQMPRQEAALQQLLTIATRLSLPVVAIQPIQFITQDDFTGHEARTCIAEGYMLADSRRPKKFTDQQYFKTQAEMARLFADLPEALANTVEIAKRCNLTLTLGENYLPDFPTPNQQDLPSYLAQESSKRFAQSIGAVISR